MTLAWLAGALVTAVLGTMVQTQFNLAALQAVGVPVPFAVRAEATWSDLIGFGPAFALIVLAGFAFAFPVAAWVGRRAASRTALYVLAGAAAVAVALLGMALATSITPVAAARTTAGLVALAATGAVGGYVFAAAAPRQ